MVLGFVKVQFKGDSQLFVNAINSDADCEAWYGHMVEEAKGILKMRPLWSISFVHREGNCATHILAKFSLTLYEENVWIKDTPNVLSHIVVEELSNILK